MNISDRIDFILRGGVWELLAEELRKRNVSAIITEIKGDDLFVIDAVNSQPETLVFKGAAAELAPQFPPVPTFQKNFFDSFPVHAPHLWEAWKYAVRYSGAGWAICVFLKEKPADELLDELRPLLSVISHWNSLRNATQLEERLAALSYIILATKNTLASVFEPMDMGYFASFLKDVLGESLFPKKIAIYHDDGQKITFIKGNNLGEIKREWLFSSKLISPAPSVCKPENFAPLGLDEEILKGLNVVVLPVAASAWADSRIFCVLAWENPCSQEILNFMELLGNVASKALEIKELHKESASQHKQLESRSFTVAAFHNAIARLMAQTDRLDLLSFMVGIFSELSQADRVKLVVYNSREKRYILVAEAFSTIIAQCFDPVSGVIDRIKIDETDEMDETQLSALGFKFGDMEKYKVYPFRVEAYLEGFVALSGIKCQAEIPDYPVVFSTLASIAAKELYYRFS